MLSPQRNFFYFFKEFNPFLYQTLTTQPLEFIVYNKHPSAVSSVNSYWEQPAAVVIGETDGNIQTADSAAMRIRSITVAYIINPIRSTHPVTATGM